MADLKLRTFGPPRLERAGRPVDLSLRKALALLVYLAVTARPQSRDALATLFWPDSNQGEARGRLRRTLHRLREELDEEILDVSAATIQVHPQATLWLDRNAFEQHVAAGLPAASSGEGVTPEQLDHLAGAVALYTDDFLSGFTLPDSPAFDEWQFFECERLRQTLAQTLEWLMEAHQARGRSRVPSRMLAASSCSIR